MWTEWTQEESNNKFYIISQEDKDQLGVQWRDERKMWDSNRSPGLMLDRRRRWISTDPIRNQTINMPSTKMYYSSNNYIGDDEICNVLLTAHVLITNFYTYPTSDTNLMRALFWSSSRLRFRGMSSESTTPAIWEMLMWSYCFHQYTSCVQVVAVTKIILHLSSEDWFYVRSHPSVCKDAFWIMAVTLLISVTN